MEKESRNFVRYRFRDKFFDWCSIRSFIYSSIVVFLIVNYSCCVSVVSADLHQDKGISKQMLENWASSFGNPLFEFGRALTKYTELQMRFQHSVNSDVRKIELDKVINEVGLDLHTALKEKVEAIRKTMAWAENKAFEYYTKPVDARPKPPSSFYNAKKLSRGDAEDGDAETHLDLKFDHHFGTFINSSYSSIHVPTFIYDKREDVIETIGWSANMDDIFKSNYQQNPTLFWQYFGSATGFLRQYPASKWPNVNLRKHEPDLYDCRIRPWYVSAANSPKNMIILHDTSGSMTGIRREIARHVVNTILDTLTENDYVNVFNFSEDTTPVVPCFKDKLVQANKENLREFRVGLDQDQTAGISNFTSALNLAFDILEKQLTENESSQCNQAIMIVSDGAPYNFEEIFKARQNPMHHVRVFTYLIGREVTDKREIMWMACANKGYYVHVATLSEVQEQVLKYMPVMSRPMVMHQTHDITWTPVYADVSTREDSNPLEVRDDGLRFVISASVPVFDQRNSTVRKGTTDAERIAIFLGVAGTDVPIKELKRIVSQFKLGVNGYAFLVNNNGYIVFHPDWRPTVAREATDKPLLKVNYNTVDLTEVELIDSDDNFRNNDSALLEMRQDMIDQEKGYKTLKIRIHQDKFRRVTIRKQRYEYAKIGNTPYTLGISVPQSLYRFHGELEIRRDTQGMDVTTFFDKPRKEPDTTDATTAKKAPHRDWKINPDWNYCEYIRGGHEYYKSYSPHDAKVTTSSPTKEDLLIHFLKEIQKARNSWAWRNTGVGINRPRHSAGNSNKDKFLESDVYACDRDLVQSLVFDANVTDVFTSEKLWNFKKSDSEIVKANGVLMSFVATRTGLTRWITFDPNTSEPTVTPTFNRFIEENPRATQELWYKRAVDRYEYDPHSFVFSVPFDAGTSKDPTVIATRAIYVKKNNRMAPVAVAGIQFNHSRWSSKFFDITSACIESRRDQTCKKTCESGEFDCFVLDDNGFILISEKNEDTGKFFGEVDGMVMEMLVNSDVYKRVRIVDYQAVCKTPQPKTSFASFLMTPLDHFRSLLSWFLAQLAWLALQLNFHSMINPDLSSVFANVIAKDEAEANEETLRQEETGTDNRSRMRPCDKEYLLYTYGSSYNTHNFSYHGLLTKCGHSGCDGYFNVHYIPHTNLILVVTDGKCRCGLNSTSINAKEVIYPQDDEMENATSSDSDVLNQLCRIPHIPLYRQRPTQCQSYNSEEDYIREDCGAGSTLSPEVTLLTLMLLLLLRQL